MTDRDKTLLRAARGALASGALTFKAETVRILIGIIDQREGQLVRIKDALMAAGCSDYTDDVARMAEEYLAQPEEG